MARERVQWIDAARGFALSLVVLMHACSLLARSGFPVAEILVPVNQVLDGLRMPTLLMISGLFAVAVREWSWSDVVRRRAGPLLWLYLLWGVINLVIVALLFGGGLAEDLVRDLMLLPLRPHIRTWYLFALAVFVVLTWALRRVPTSLVVPAAALISVCAYAVWPNPGPGGGWHWWLFLAQHWVYFVCAERGAELYRAIARRTTPVLASCATAAFILVGTGFWSAGWLYGEGSGRSALPALLVAVLGTLASLTVFPVVADSRLLAWSRAIGRESLGVYVIHYWVLGAFVLVAARVLADAGVTGLGVVVPLVVTALALVTAFGMTLALKRWAPVPFLRPWWDMSEQKVERDKDGARAQAE